MFKKRTRDLVNKHINGLLLLKLIGKTKGGNAIGSFQCHCETVFEARITNVLSRNTTSCGCKNGRLKHGYRLTHPHELQMWYNMKSRAHDDLYWTNKNPTKRIEEDWDKEDPKPFIEHLSTLEHYNLLYFLGLELDRKNNKEGYLHGNLRLVTHQENNANK